MLLLVITLLVPISVNAKVKSITASDSNATKDIPKIKKTGTYNVICEKVTGSLRVGFKAPKDGNYVFTMSGLSSENNVNMRAVAELDKLFKKKYIKQAQVNAQYLDTLDNGAVVFTYTMSKGTVIYPTLLSPMLVEDGLLVSCNYTLNIKYTK